MKKYHTKCFGILLLALCLFYSCNFRIYTNGKFDHKEKGLTSMWRTTNDSCIVLLNENMLPKDAVLVNNTEIRSPFAWLTLHAPFEIMSNELKTQAAKVNANMILVDSTYSKKSTRFHVRARMYSLNKTAITAYRRQADSTLASTKDYCIIHIKNLADVEREGIHVMFNDSLLLALAIKKEPNRPIRPNKAFIMNTQAYTFKIDHGGELIAKYITSKGKVDKYFENAKVLLEKGKEYYFYLHAGEGDEYSAHNTPYLQFVKYDKSVELSPF